MKTSAQFDQEIARKHGVDSSIVWTLVDDFCRIQRALNKKKMYKDEIWWCHLPDEVFDELVPYYTQSKRSQIIERLEKKGLLKIDGSTYSTYISNTPGTKKKEIVVKETETKDKMFPVTKIVNDAPQLVEEKATKIVNDLIDGFQAVNPDYEKFFRHKTQRNALYRMLENYQADILFYLVRMLQETNNEKYAPMIVTPLQLESKAPQLITFIKRNKKSKQGGIF